MLHTEGKCQYNEGSTCIASSTFEIYSDSDEGISYEWNVTGEDVTFFGPKYAKQITVYTRSDTTSSFIVNCKVTYKDNTTVTHSGVFEHTRDVIEQDTILCVSDLSEIQSGQCHYQIGETCKAYSKYKVVTNFQHNVSYKWEVQNGFIESGQGTDIITVSTDSNKHERFYVQCYVYDDVTEANVAGWFSHTRYLDKSPESNVCAYFRVYNPELGCQEAYGPIDVTYYRTSGLIHGVCPPHEKGKHYHPVEPENNPDNIDPDDPDKRKRLNCYNFNVAVSEGSNIYENFKQVVGNFTTSDIQTSCPDNEPRPLQPVQVDETCKPQRKILLF